LIIGALAGHFILIKPTGKLIKDRFMSTRSPKAPAIPRSRN